MQFPRTETREIKILNGLKHENMVCLREMVTSMSEFKRIAATASSR